MNHLKCNHSSDKQLVDSKCKCKSILFEKDNMHSEKTISSRNFLSSKGLNLKLSHKLDFNPPNVICLFSNYLDSKWLPDNCKEITSLL